MKLYIKNMVCRRCKIVVNNIFTEMGLHPLNIDLGEVEIQEEDISSIKEDLNKKLLSVGFSLLDDKKTRLIEQIKTLIIELIQTEENDVNLKLSEYLSQMLNKDYSTLSNLFSEVEGITIEKYYINQKIEKVKELLVYDELTLSEIAFKLNYSSASYLSNQFKKITGLTPGHFKKIGLQKRKSLEEL